MKQLQFNTYVCIICVINTKIKQFGGTSYFVQEVRLLNSKNILLSVYDFIIIVFLIHIIPEQITLCHQTLRKK